MRVIDPEWDAYLESLMEKARRMEQEEWGRSREAQLAMTADEIREIYAADQAGDRKIVWLTKPAGV